MKSMVMFLLSGVRSLVVILIFASSAYSADEKQVTFYSTYGHQDGDNWVIPMRLWIHERRGWAEDIAVKKVRAGVRNLGPEEINSLRSRITDFVADSESGDEVSLVFDHDPAAQEYRVRDSHGNVLESNLNGFMKGTIEIPLAKAQELLRRQGSQNGWLTYRATSSDHTGMGRVRLLEPVGLSVISDIDDTIKVTEIPAGKKIVVHNTFFRKFASAPEMATTYQQWNGAAFHYVSGGPWQLYGPLSEFLVSEEGGFPEGSFHMKSIPKNLLNVDTWRDLKDLVANENSTFDLKVGYISEIIQAFPARKFILIGDSGEKDPEVYRRIRELFPDKVQEIRIRDVVNDRQKKPGRLKGMTIIPAVTVVRGASQLDGLD